MFRAIRSNSETKFFDSTIWRIPEPISPPVNLVVRDCLGPQDFLSSDPVIESSTLELLLQELRQSNRIAIDTEADSLHSYLGRLCLVQLAFDQKIELVDTLADIKIEVLMAVLKQNH